MTRQIKPGLVALCDIWPGNGVGLFLQPQSPHRPTRLQGNKAFIITAANQSHSSKKIFPSAEKAAEILPLPLQEIWLAVWIFTGSGNQTVANCSLSCRDHGHQDLNQSTTKTASSPLAATGTAQWPQLIIWKLQQLVGMACRHMHSKGLHRGWCWWESVVLHLCNTRTPKSQETLRFRK